MSSKNILVLTHGKFGEELVKSAEMIVGSLENVNALSLMPDMSAEEFRSIVQEFLDETKDEIICLVDMFGGTPSNTIMYLSQKYDITIISGVNLPMLLEVYMNLNNETIENLADIALETIIESGKNVSKLLSKERSDWNGFEISSNRFKINSWTSSD